MAQRKLIAYDETLKRMIIPGLSDTYVAERPVHLTEDLSTDGLIDGRYVGQDGSKLDFLTITAPVDMDAIQAEMAFITVTQPVDLDQMELDIAALAAAVVLKGSWDASTTLFPVSTKAGESWICSVGGTVAGIEFAIDDRVVALIDGASQANATHWHKLDYTDKVLSVAGKTGAVTLLEADITDLQAYMLPVDLDSLSKLNAIVGESLMTAEALAVTPFTQLQFTPGGDPTWAEGLVFYSNVTKTLNYYTNVPDVTMNVGEEHWIKVINNSGAPILDGSPVYKAGVSVGGLPQIAPVIANGNRVIGVATHTMADGEEGRVTIHGTVTGPDFSTYGQDDTLYASTTVPGALTNVAPIWPDAAIEIGTVLTNTNPGVFFVDINRRVDVVVAKSYSFSARNAASGTYYQGGFYDAPTADANLTNVGPTVAYGSDTGGQAAHAFIVWGGGATDGLNITITVTGATASELGVLNETDSVVLYTGPVGSLTVDQYLETTEKWVGEVVFTLTSDGPTFSADFNYGFAKYEDFANTNGIVATIDVVGLADATDANFDLEIMHHDALGWTYAATGFVPGNTPIAKRSTDFSIHSGIVNGKPFAWKRIELNDHVRGAEEQGILFRVTTSVNNCIAYMDTHLIGVLDYE